MSQHDNSPTGQKIDRLLSSIMSNALVQAKNEFGYCPPFAILMPETRTRGDSFVSTMAHKEVAEMMRRLATDIDNDVKHNPPLSAEVQLEIDFLKGIPNN